MKELSDDDILNYLLNSDFNDGNITIDELKYLLLKFRTFYRIKSSRYLRDVGELKVIINDLEKQLKYMKLSNEKLNTSLIEKSDELNNLKGDRKLSTLERIRGWIKI